MQSDSSISYVRQLSVYTGKKGDTIEVGLRGNVVRELVENIKGN